MEDNTSKVYVGRAGSLLSDALLAPGTGSVPGASLFVINLCTSIAPVTASGKSIPGLESHKLYQVARSEDGRTRHRLRLGFFASQEEADQALAMVRDSYPTAFTTSLSDDDRKFARGFLPDTSASGRRPAPQVTLVEKAPAPAPKEPAKPVAAMQAPAAPAVRVTTVVAAPPARANTASTASAPATTAAAPIAAVPTPALTPTPAPTPAAAPTPRAVAPIATASKPAAPAAPATPKQIVLEPPPAKPAPVKPTVIELSLAADPEAPLEEPVIATAPATAFHVGKGVDIPSMSLTLEAAPVAPVAQAAPEPAVAQAVAKKSPAIAEPQVAQRKPAAIAAKPTPPAPAAASSVTRTVPPVPRSQREADRPMPELDSTQTIRALTSAELNDDSQEKWFAIQLAASDQPVNLDAMPHLDIFEAYRLYSVANAGSGKIVHSLRIGFFREQVSAEAVAGYLRTFFASPSVLRISTAEYLRFMDAPSPRAPVAKSEGKVVELNQARERAKPTIPTVTMEVPTPAQVDPNATGSFKPNATGSFKATSTGSHKALNQAAKSAVNAKRSSAKASITGKHKVLPKKSLQEQLLDEAREVELSESAIRKLPKSDSLLSRLVGKLTK